MQKSIVSALLSRRAVNPEAKMPMHILIQCLQGYKDTLPSLFDVLTPSELSLCVEDYRALTLVEQARVREKTKAFDENGVLLYCPKAINDITRQLATYRAYLEAETASVARNAKLKHLKVLKTALSVQSGDKVYYQRLARFTDALNEDVGDGVSRAESLSSYRFGFQPLCLAGVVRRWLQRQLAPALASGGTRGFAFVSRCQDILKGKGLEILPVRPTSNAITTQAAAGL